MILAELIDKTIIEVQGKINSSNTTGKVYWEATLQALQEVRGKSDAIEAFGEDRFKDLLTEIDLMPDLQMDALVDLIPNLTADEVINAKGESTARLDADTQLRKQRRDELIALLYRIGQIGVRLVLSAIA